MAARSVEARVALIDQKIEKKRGEIADLEAQKQKLLHPVNIKTVMAKAKEAGLSPEEIAEKLGLEI
jgi:cell division protein FtsL